MVLNTIFIGAMLRHKKDDFSVRKGGCGALCNLAWLHPEHRKGLVMVGAALVVATASQTVWGESAELVDWARRFFIALFDDGNTEKFIVFFSQLFQISNIGTEKVSAMKASTTFSVFSHVKSMPGPGGLVMDAPLKERFAKRLSIVATLAACFAANHHR